MAPPARNTPSTVEDTAAALASWTTEPKASAAEVHSRRLEVDRRYIDPFAIAAVTFDLQRMALLPRPSGRWNCAEYGGRRVRAQKGDRRSAHSSNVSPVKAPRSSAPDAGVAGGNSASFRSVRIMPVMKTCLFSVHFFAPEPVHHLHARVVSGRTLPKPYVAAGSGCGDFSACAALVRYHRRKKQDDDEVA